MTEEGQANNRRRFPRLNAPVYFRPARFRSARTPVIDIGLGGLRVYSDDPFRVGDRLDVELFLPDNRRIDCLVRVAWLNSLPAGSPAAYDVGLELLDATGDGLRSLATVLGEEK